jgi:hypothetical protein
MAITATFQADFSKFDKSLADAKTSLKSFEVTGKGVQQSLERMAKSLSGVDIKRQAEIAAAAVQKIGGSTKLTETEQRKLNATVTEAIAKYKALGQTAPDALIRLQRETKQAEAATKSVSGVLGGLKGVLAGAFAGVSIAFLVKDVVALGGQLSDLSAKTGIGVRALQEFQFAGKTVGVSLEAISTAVGQMQKRVAGGDDSAVGALKKLGISVETFRGLRPEEQFQAVADKIAAIPDPAARAKLAMDIMGKGALEVMPLLVGGLGKLRAEAERLGIVLSDETVSNLDALGDAMDTLGLAGKAALANALVPMVPLLKDLAGASIEAAKWIGGIGAALKATQIWFQLTLSTLASWITGLDQAGIAVLNLQKTLNPLSNISGNVDQAIAGLSDEAERMRYIATDLSNNALLQMIGAEAGVGEAARKAAPSIFDVAKASSAQADATKLANAAADEYAKSLDALDQAASRAGITTQSGLNKELSQLVETLNVASRVGTTALQSALLSLGDEFAKLAEKAKRSGLDVGIVIGTFEQFAETVGLSEQAMVDWERSIENIPIGTLTDGLKQIDISAQVAATNQQRVTDAFKAFGIETPQALQKAADAAVRNFEIIRASGVSTPEQIRTAHEKMVEAVNLATGRLPSMWEQEVLPRITAVVQTLNTAIQGTFAQMLLGAKGFKDGFEDIWKSIKASVARILTEILGDFVNRFLKGLLNALTGAQGGFASAFAGLIPGFGGGGGGFGGILGGLLGGGGGAAAGGAFGGIGSAVPVSSLFGGGLGPAGAAGGAGAGGLFGMGALGTTAVVGGAALAAYAAYKWYQRKQANIHANDSRDAFLSQFGGQGTGEGSGFHTVAAKLTAAGAGAGGGALFDNFINARKPEEVAKAIEAINAKLAEYDAKTQAATASEAAQQSQIEATKAALEEKTKAIQSQMESLDTELKQLDASEAPEAVMGVVEQRTRERIQREKDDLTRQLKDAQAAAQAAIDAIGDAGSGSLDTLTTQGQDTIDGIAGGFIDLGKLTKEQIDRIKDMLAEIGKKGLTIPVTYTYPNGQPPTGEPPDTPPSRPSSQTPGFASGTPGLGFVDFGRETLVRLHGREAVIPENRAGELVNPSISSPQSRGGSASPTVVILQVDGREFARAVAQPLPGEVRRLGVRVRT